MSLYDTHFHLDLQKDKQNALDCIISQKIYTIAMTNLPDLYRKGIEQYKNEYVRIALGFHPELIHDFKHQIPLMWDLVPTVRYIGEVGLDFSNNSFVNEQVQFFTELIDKCKLTNKIVSIHSRKAGGKVLDIIGDSFSFKPILHWFSGTLKEAEIASQRGYYFSVNSSMVMTKKFSQLLEILPKDKILLETDSPFCRGNMSQVEMLRIVCDRLGVNGIDPWANFKMLLRL